MGAEWLEVQPPMGHSNHLAVHVHRGTTEQLPHNYDGLTHSLGRLATDKLHFAKTSDASSQTQHGSTLSHFVQGRNGHSCQRWMARIRVSHHGAELDVSGMYSGERQARVHLTKKALIGVPEGLIATRLLEASQFDQACWRIVREIEGTHAQVHATASCLLSKASSICAASISAAIRKGATSPAVPCPCEASVMWGLGSHRLHPSTAVRHRRGHSPHPVAMCRRQPHRPLQPCHCG